MAETNESRVTRVDPFRDPWGSPDLFRRMLGGLWEDEDRLPTAVIAPVDVTESDDKYVVRMEIPGVAKEDVTIEVQDGALNIRGEKKSRRDEKDDRGRRLECRYGTFARTFSLPQDADPEKIGARFRDGVLEVSLEKRPETKPKQIVIKT